MAKLTNEQILFLKSQNLSPSMLFDATGLSQAERLRAMDEQGIHFYFGGAPCKKEGHTLRTKSGHCIQCHTGKIAYQLRNSAAGYVYLAYSPEYRYVKIGYSRLHPQERGAFLRNEAYGNIRDWDIKKFARFDEGAGKAEFLIHAALAQYNKPITYEKGKGNFVECRELFACDLDLAEREFDAVAVREGAFRK